MSPRRVLIGLLAVFLTTGIAAETYVPPELRDWQEWVLDGKEYRECPYVFNRALDRRDDFICAWPGTLALSVESSGARFSQSWTVFAPEQWIALPGSTKHWPDKVAMNGGPVEVVAKNGVPGVSLSTGTWRLTGQFGWDERPAVMRIPAASGLLELTVDGTAVQRPEINRAGVFLGERKLDTRARDSVRTVVHRLVADDVPTSLLTRLQIDVSGGVREEEFAAVLPDGFVPLSIESALPAKLEADGTLHLQVRPGRWTVQLLARGEIVADTIERAPVGSNMPADEIWSYRSNNELRATTVEGLSPVDPLQADVPEGWDRLPAFRMQQDDSFVVAEQSRGVVSLSNDLELNRTMWLGFDGAGFVVTDEVTGTMRTDWRLDMAGPYTLQSASEYDENLLITDGLADGQTGIEVRNSDVWVEALGQADNGSSMPVTGWTTRFGSVHTTLNLPPGHKLLAAPGVDDASHSWLSQWRLLDFFLVLIITIATWRLFGRFAGIIALVALGLSYQELQAPVWLWLNLLIGIALMRVAPAGRLRQAVFGYQALSALALVLALVPFVADQLRIAIYPQLEPQFSGYTAPASDIQDLIIMEREEDAMARRNKPADRSYSSSPAMEEIIVTGAKIERGFSRYAPNAIVQAGQGIPSWSWNSYSLSWNGPVDASQTMRLVIMPRWLVTTLRVLAVGMLLLFAGILAAEISGRRWQLPGGLTLGKQQASSLLLLGVLSGLSLVAPEARADIPNGKMLQQLEQRLLEAPDCVPHCAEIVAADITVGADEVRMQLSIHALEFVAVPLPGSVSGWRPNTVVRDGVADISVHKAGDNSLWLYFEPGQHTVDLRGPIPEADSLEIPFITQPRVVTVDSEAWLVAGIKDRRLVSGSLQLTRLQTASGEDASVRWESSRFPAFARVERRLELDLDWQVRTTVYRVAPTEGAITLDIPLLQNEQVVSGEYTVNDDRILVTMQARQRSVSWVSNLPLKTPLELVAADNTSWQEVWQFAVGNIWNVTFDGLAESNSGVEADGVRVATFHPRRGERLTLQATRPEASAGSTLAFDAVEITVSEGSRTRDVELELQYRSTRGSQHVIKLPPGAEVTSVMVDFEEQTLRAEDGQVSLPILPGSHNVSIAWREDGSTGLYSTTPDLDLGAPASNIRLTVTKSRDRWLLLTRGPELGPAILYWSELAALIVFALILGRIKVTTLTTWHWLLLGLGFSTFSWPALGWVIAWLLLCGFKSQLVPHVTRTQFNALQVVIAGLTVVALASIVGSLVGGLLGTPDMNVSGYGSAGNVLRWFADSSESVLPTAGVVSVPMWVYKGLILAWALWLCFALLRWLPWVWNCFSEDGFWRKRESAKPAISEGGA